MGFGIDQEVDCDDSGYDLQRPLSEFEKMLDYHDLEPYEFHEMSANQQANLRWNYKKLGSKKT